MTTFSSHDAEPLFVTTWRLVENGIDAPNGLCPCFLHDKAVYTHTHTHSRAHTHTVFDC